MRVAGQSNVFHGKAFQAQFRQTRGYFCALAHAWGPGPTALLQLISLCGEHSEIPHRRDESSYETERIGKSPLPPLES